jgi:hypothetical protein
MENKAIMTQLVLLFQHFPEGEKIHAEWTASALRIESRIFRMTDTDLTTIFCLDN